MPEIAAVGLVGAIITFLVVNLNLYWVHRGFQKPEFLCLNHNLSKVARYWSLEQGRVVSIESGKTQEEVQKRDHARATRSAFLFGTLLIFLSWLGLVLFGLYCISTTKWAKSRLEQRIFSSVLVQNSNLAPSEVEGLLKEFESLGG